MKFLNAEHVRLVEDVIWLADQANAINPKKFATSCARRRSACLCGSLMAFPTRRKRS